MMELLVVIVFVLGYTTIIFEQSLRIDKLIPSLLMMTFSWVLIALGMDHFNQWFGIDAVFGETSLIHLYTSSHDDRIQLLESTLLHHFGKTAEILIFLIGAMTMVELIDHFQGFDVFKILIKARKKISLLWIISMLAFGLSAIIDNLTTTIVLISIFRKINTNPEDRIWFAGFIVMSANAGGAWSPVGDVTTTMLWVANKVTTLRLMTHIVIPSIVNVAVPLLIASFLPVFHGEILKTKEITKNRTSEKVMLFSGLILIILVPVFKMTIHLPPYIGMMGALAIFALIAEIQSRGRIQFTHVEIESTTEQRGSPTLSALKKIEIPTILFFLGIMMAVAALESIGSINHFGKWISHIMPDKLFITILGLFSAVIDNVPLVAASIGMFSHGIDSDIWHFIAYAAGTGGSILIIGSAAGVVAMGMEKISFGWYLKHITPLAIAGYFSGVLCFIFF
jgi:Na+/H+ antiporter NhaD/arsenite permease-like protein